MSTQSFDDLCDRYERCYEYVHDAGEMLMRINGVVGVGIGPKARAGELIPEQPCYMVYVHEKKPLSLLAARDLVPREILGIATDVVAIGSRKSPVHNETDARWLLLSRDNFIELCRSREEGYRKVS